MSLWGRREDVELTGTLEEANTGATELTGANTVFTTELETGVQLTIDDYFYTVIEITDDTTLSISPALAANIAANSVVTINDSPNWVDGEVDLRLVDKTEAANSDFRDIGLKTPGWNSYSTYTTAAGTRRKVESLVAMKNPTS